MGAASVPEYVASLNEEQRRHVSAFIDFMSAEYPQLVPKISFSMVFISEFISQSDMDVIQSIAPVINMIELGYGRLAAEGKEKNYKKVITLDELCTVEAIFTIRVKEILKSSSLFDFSEWRMVYHLLNSFDPEYTKHYLESSLTQDKNILRFLNLFVAVWTGSGTEYGVDKPVDYNPIDRLVGIYNDIVDKKILTVKEYADGVNQSETDIQREVEKANLMVEFLEFINAPKQFHLARTMNLNDPLKELNTILKQCKDNEKREDLKNVIFANFLMQPHGDMTRYMRKIKKIVSNAKFLDEYLDEQMATTEKVCDLLEETPVVTDKVINEKIRTQEDLKEDFAHSTEKWVSKADGDATRNRPAQQAEKAFEMLDTIDTNIFKKLNEEQKDDVRNRLDQIQEVLNRIKGELDA